MPTPPDLTAAKAYLGSDVSWSDADIQSALDSEAGAQTRACRMPTVRLVEEVTTTDTSTVVTAAEDSFKTTLDVGATITGTGIPADTTIVAVNSATEAVLSQAATASGTITATVDQLFWSDLAEARFRRVAANLANRALPLGVQANMSEAAVQTTRVGGGDREVRRLEGPFRRRTVG